VKVGAVTLLQIWMHPLGICKISKTNMHISQLTTCDTLPHSPLASFERPRLDTTHFQGCMYRQDALPTVTERSM